MAPNSRTEQGHPEAEHWLPGASGTSLSMGGAGSSMRAERSTVWPSAGLGCAPKHLGRSSEQALQRWVFAWKDWGMSSSRVCPGPGRGPGKS